MRTQLVDGLFADLLQVVRFLRVYILIRLRSEASEGEGEEAVKLCRQKKLD